MVRGSPTWADVGFDTGVMLDGPFLRMTSRPIADHGERPRFRYAGRRFTLNDAIAAAGRSAGAGAVRRTAFALRPPRLARLQAGRLFHGSCANTG
jgi:hypothetical protein